MIRKRYEGIVVSACMLAVSLVIILVIKLLTS